MRLTGRGVDESVQLARSAGLIIPKEPVARVDIPSTEEQAPPSLSVVDLPDIGKVVTSSNGIFENVTRKSLSLKQA